MAAEVYSSVSELLPEQQAQIFSVIGRLYLQLGDLKSAQSYFNRISDVDQEREENRAIVKVNE